VPDLQGGTTFVPLRSEDGTTLNVDVDITKRPWDERAGYYRCDSCDNRAWYKHEEWNLYSCEDCVEWILHPFNVEDWDYLDIEDEDEDDLEVPPAVPAESIMEANALIILRRLTNIDTPDICMAGSDVLDSQTS
jgi:hypothetical protein